MTADLPDCSTEYLNQGPAWQWPAVSEQQSQVLTSGLVGCKVSLSLAIISGEDRGEERRGEELLYKYVNYCLLCSLG